MKPNFTEPVIFAHVIKQKQRLGDNYLLCKLLLSNTPNSLVIFLIEGKDIPDTIHALSSDFPQRVLFWTFNFSLSALLKRTQNREKPQEISGRKKEQNLHAPHTGSPLKKAIRIGLERSGLSSLLALFFYYHTLKRRFRSLQTVPSIIFTNGDRHIFLEQAALKYGIKNDIPTVVLNYTQSANSESLLIGKMKKTAGVLKSQISMWGRFLERLAPQNYIYDGSERFSFYTPEVAVTLKLFGTLSENPWEMGCGKSRYIMASSLEEKESWVKRGVKTEKILVAPTLAQIYLQKSFNNKKLILNNMMREDGLDISRQNLVFAVSQLWEHGMIDDKHHFYNQLLDIVKSLRTTGCNLFLSLHPKMKKDDYLFLEGERTKILNKRLHDVLPVFDLLVAVNSSTLYWAVACGIPSVNLNFWGLDTSIYASYESINNVTNIDQMLGVVSCLLSQDNSSAIEFDQKLTGYALKHDNNLEAEFIRKILSLSTGDQANIEPLHESLSTEGNQ